MKLFGILQSQKQEISIFFNFREILYKTINHFKPDKNRDKI